eukprot:4413801-Prymnesium_polylepis.1
MSPPTDSHGPTEAITSTDFGPQSSNASYSGDATPTGLSAAMSGRCGTNCSVTARPTHFWPGRSGRAPSMKESGHPMTQRPSMSDWVDRVESFSSSSSLTIVADAAGPEASILRGCTSAMGTMRPCAGRRTRLAMRASIVTEAPA